MSFANSDPGAGMVMARAASHGSSAAKALFVLGTALTVYWQPLARRVPLKPSDVLFLAALAAWGLSLWPAKRVPSIPRSLALSLVALYASILTATIIGGVRDALPASFLGNVLLGRLAVDMVLFVSVFTLLQADDAFRRRLCLAFLSPIALFAVLLVPRFAALMWEGGGEPRFQGLTPGANTAALAFLPAFAFAYTLAMHEMIARRRRQAVAYALVSVAMVVLVLWTHSRGYIFATLACAILGAAVNASHLTLPRLKLVAVTALVYAVVAAAILALAPRSFPTLWARIVPSPTAAPGGSRTPLRAALENLRADPHIVAAGYYSRLLLTHPFGLGVNYETRFKVFVPSTREFGGANTILDVPVYGGVGAILTMGYFAVRVAGNVKRTLSAADAPHAPYTVGAATALAGLWIAAITLGSPLFDYQFWILLALALL